jgi:DNA replication protein DnaC
MNKQINLIINGKGGVGKSFFATNFLQYLKDSGIEHRAIGSDHENSTLKRFHPEAEFINLEHRREIDRVFTTAESSDLLVIDCRAASTDLFIEFFDEVERGSRRRMLPPIEPNGAILLMVHKLATWSKTAMRR